MLSEIIGFVGGLFVLLSIIPCCVRIVRGTHVINSGTWFLWVVLGFAILFPQLSFVSAAALWPSIFGCINPIVVGLCMLCGRKERRPLGQFEIVAFAGAIIALVVGSFTYESEEYAPYAAYLALIADACAAVPIILMLCVYDDMERPFPYVAFGIGYMLSMFASAEYAVMQYVVPAYMVCISACAAAPLIRYRMHMKTPLSAWREWM